MKYVQYESKKINGLPVYGNGTTAEVLHATFRDTVLYRFRSFEVLLMGTS